MIKKAVIPAAGLGTRLLPITKELPKEMLPLFSNSGREGFCVKPMLQLIFEQLYYAGFREFCFIVGRGKRAIEDHFTPDWDFVDYLEENKKSDLMHQLEVFYRMINDSTIIFINQPKPKGFGDAVLKARAFTDNENFLVHAGDNLILSNSHNPVEKLINIFDELNADAVFFVERRENSSMYGVIEGVQISKDIYKVKRIVEKPKVPPSNIATIAVYVFRPTIYRQIESVNLGEGNELQLTDAIQELIIQGGNVYALELKKEKRLDIGTSKNYWNALKTTYKFKTNKTHFS